jgi:putative ABC transport system ATP-binding protein
MIESQSISVIEMKAVTVAAMADPGFIVLKNMDWSVAPGDFWVVAGQQHSGKSDFLMMTGGLMPPAGGYYRFFGNETRIFDESRLADRLRIGFVFETAQLFHYLTIAENVALPLRYHRNLGPEEGGGAVAGLLEWTGLKPIADVTPANLARSWLKRAGLARALAMRPEVLLLDNPLGGLDASHSRWWLHFLDELSRGHPLLDGKPMTVVATTDDLRPWRHEHRKFVLLKDKQFVPLGSWVDVKASNEPLVRELLAAPTETIEAGSQAMD